jgi:Ni/Fe-hydrogenase subunit HybB-like protein
MEFARFLIRGGRAALSGGLRYRLWLAFLALLIVLGVIAYLGQLSEGLIRTNMRDQISWAFYIGNFTFMVGVAAAAVLLVIPAYVYGWKPIKEVAILGEVLAVCAILMALMFVTVDIGRPDRLWHMIPFLGKLNFPSSLLAWDSLVLTGYLLLNLVILVHVLYATYRGRSYNKRLIHPLILLSIPAAISIHTVTAFLYNGLGARPFWNASILAPRFLASAFSSGPALLVVVFQILNRTTKFEIKQEAIWKLAELMAYAMFLNLFLFAAEVFKEFYSSTEHVVHMRYLYFGLEGHAPLVPYAWTSLGFSLVAFILLLLPKTRKNPITLNLGCLLIYAGVYIEKGMGLVIPGMTPDTLGEIYDYGPSWTEVGVGAGIFAIGFLLFTLLTKGSIAILTGDLRAADASLALPAKKAAIEPEPAPQTVPTPLP